MHACTHALDWSSYLIGIRGVVWHQCADMIHHLHALPFRVVGVVTLAVVWWKEKNKYVYINIWNKGKKMHAFMCTLNEGRTRVRVWLSACVRVVRKMTLYYYPKKKQRRTSFVWVDVYVSEECVWVWLHRERMCVCVRVWSNTHHIATFIWTLASMCVFVCVILCVRACTFVVRACVCVYVWVRACVRMC